MDQLSDVFTAVTHPTRRAILKQLAQGPRRFLDIAGEFDTALNAVTKHLKILERAELISREKRGREVFISLNAQPLQQAATWVHEYERFWNNKLDKFTEHFTNRGKRKEK